MPPFPSSDAFVREAMGIIDRARVEKGWTQAQLGDAAGITQSTLSKYVRLELTVNLAQYHDLCIALGLSVSEVAAQAFAQSRTG